MDSEHVNLKVVGQDGSVVHFKIRKHTALKKLMSAYVERAVSIFSFNIYLSLSLSWFNPFVCLFWDAVFNFDYN